MFFHVVHVSSLVFAKVEQVWLLPSTNAFLMMTQIRPAIATGLAVVIITLKVKSATNDCLLLFSSICRCARASAACGGSRGIRSVMHLVLKSGKGDTHKFLIKYNRAGQLAVAQNSNSSMTYLYSYRQISSLRTTSFRSGGGPSTWKPHTRAVLKTGVVL